jgi:hypothetical protein
VQLSGPMLSSELSVDVGVMGCEWRRFSG